MLAFCHLFIGTAVGLLLFRATGRRWAVAACALGALLPDLIDKPLGHLILRESLDFGRIYAHTFLFLAIISVAALVAWKWKSSRALGFVAVGIGTHLVLDSMWDIPITLFYPALGQFEAHHYPDYLESSILMEITSPLEWLFALSVVIIFLGVYRDEVGERLRRSGERMAFLLRPALFLTVVLGAAYLFRGVAFAETLVDIEADITLGASAVLGAAVLLQMIKNGSLEEKSLQ